MNPVVPELDPLPFPELLASLQRDGATCTVGVADALFEGVLRLEDGTVQSAAFGGLAGEAAVAALLIADELRCRVVHEARPPAQQFDSVHVAPLPHGAPFEPRFAEVPTAEPAVPAEGTYPVADELLGPSLPDQRAGLYASATLIGMGFPPPPPPLPVAPMLRSHTEEPRASTLHSRAEEPRASSARDPRQELIPGPPETDSEPYTDLRSWAQRVVDERARMGGMRSLPAPSPYEDEDEDEDPDDDDTKPVFSQSSVFPSRFARDRTLWIAALLCAPILIALLVRATWFGPGAPPPPAPVALPSTAPVHVPKVVAPTLTGTVAAVVSPGGLAPTVMLRVLVGADGTVKQATVQSPRPGLGQLEKQAAEAARAYHFKPATADGRAVEHWVTLPVPFRSAPVAREVDVKGSDTIGATLGSVWARGLERKEPGLSVKLETLGSSTGIAGLLDGSAAVAMSSRPIRPEELAFAERLGLQLREVVVGFDGIVAIVHPDNPVRALDLEAVAQVFAQRVTRWKQLAGADAPIRVLGRPSYSGTHTFLRERMLATLGPGGGFGPTVETIEAAKDIVARVANDVYAIGYVGIGQLDSSVRALAIAPAVGASAVAPKEDTIRDGSYPIARPLYLYLREDSDHAARAWVDYALSPDGQAAVANNGFVSVSASPSSLLAAETPAQHVAPPALTRLYFGPNSATIEQDSRALLLAAAATPHAGKRALVVGHADSAGKVDLNERLARQRADAVVKVLRQHGWSTSALEVEVAAATHPLASNTTADGRKANRRVDLMVLSH